MSPAHPASEDLARRLNGILGPENVRNDAAVRDFHSQDLSNERLALAAMVISPGSVEQLSAAARAITAAGFAIIPRGGGMSYTMGYLPIRDASVIVDLRRMNRIVEINRDDMYVVVEAGVTWDRLHAALKGTDVRPAFWGTLSGLHATVGGALSQDAALFGSGIHGTAAHNVQGLEVVLSDGRIVRTGSWAHRCGTPFFRYYGPDLTGLFCADCGAFGIKARAALTLVAAPGHVSAASFAFDTFDEMVCAQAEICRRRLAAECIGFDPYFNRGFESMGLTLGEGVELLGAVARSKGGKFGGLLASLRVAAGGKRLLRKVNYSLHVTVEGRNERVTESMLDEVGALAASNAGWSIGNAIPTAMRAKPFGSIRTNLLGSAGQIWMPLHAFFPLSKAAAAVAATEAFFRRNDGVLAAQGIAVSNLTAMAATHFMIEPGLYWQDRLGPVRLSAIEPQFQDRWRDLPANDAVRNTALRLRRELTHVYSALGGTQQQIGKYYPFQSAIEPHTWRTLEALKRALDPDGTMNPGALGFSF